MATFTITPLTSVFAAPGNAFELDTAGVADALNVQLGAILMTVGVNSYAARLKATLGWTVDISGSLIATNTGTAGLKLDGGNAGLSTINVSEDGSIRGQAGIIVGDGAASTGSAATITNRGTITATDGVGILFQTAGAHAVTNYGTISGNFGILDNFIPVGAAAGSNDTITNYGTMDVISAGAGTNSLTNSGTIRVSPFNEPSYQGGSGQDTVKNLAGGVLGGAIYLGNGGTALAPQLVENSGSIGQDLNGISVLGGTGNDTVSNLLYISQMDGAVSLGNGGNKLTNFGYVGFSNGYTYTGGTGTDDVTNTGGYFGRAVFLGGSGDLSANTVTNTGTISHDGSGLAVVGGGGTDTVTNSGYIAGFLQLLGGANTLNNNAGIIAQDSNGLSYDGGLAGDTITNKAGATIVGMINAYNGANSLNNAGTIGSAVLVDPKSYVGGDGIDLIVNSGTINGAIQLGGTATSINANITATQVSVNNTGTIGGYVEGENGADTVANTSTATTQARIEGWINLLNGTNTLNNTGGYVGEYAPSHYSYRGGDGVDTVNNTNVAGFRGTLIGGVFVGAGTTNTVTNFGDIGKMNDGLAFTFFDYGVVALGASNDTVTNNLGATIAGSLQLQDGTNTVTNSGAIGSNTSGGSVVTGLGQDTVTNNLLAAMAGGVDLGAGLNALTNYGQIGKFNSAWSYYGTTGQDTITNYGTMAGGVFADNGTAPVLPATAITTVNSLVNRGTIGVGGGGFSFAGGNGIDTVVNSGTMAGGITLKQDVGTAATNNINGAVISVDNTGTIGAVFGASVYGDDGIDTVKNTSSATFRATMAGGVELYRGTNTFTNSGGSVGATNPVDGSSYLGLDGADTVSNLSTATQAATFAGYVDVGNGTNGLTNSGNIDGTDATGRSYVGGSGADTVANSGRMAGNVFAGHGANKLTNNGTVEAGGLTSQVISYQGGDGTDTVTNTGTLAGAIVMLDLNGSGSTQANTADNTGGKVGAYVQNGNIQISIAGDIGKDTVTNTTTIASRAVLDGGVLLYAGENGFTNTGGSVGKNFQGWSYTGGNDKDAVINKNFVSGAITAAGTMAGYVDVKGGVNSLDNSGNIYGSDGSGWSYLGGTGNDTITNSGLMAGGVFGGDGTPPVLPATTITTLNKLVNSGTMGASVDDINTSKYHLSFSGGNGIDVVSNSGTMAGGIWLNADAAPSTTDNLSAALVVGTVQVSVVNTGTIGVDSYGNSIVGDNGKDTVFNTSSATVRAVLEGSVFLNGGDNVFTNTGGSVGTSGVNGYSYRGTGGNDTVSNASTAAQAATFAGYVDMGGGNNSVSNTGNIDGKDANGWSYVGGTGNDTITNSGKMAGGVLAGADGDAATTINKLTNNGTIGASVTSQLSYQGGTGIDIVINNGVMEGGIKLRSNTIESTDNLNAANPASVVNKGALGPNGFGISVEGGMGQKRWKTPVPLRREQCSTAVLTCSGATTASPTRVAVSDPTSFSITAIPAEGKATPFSTPAPRCSTPQCPAAWSWEGASTP